MKILDELYANSLKEHWHYLDFSPKEITLPMALTPKAQ